MITRRRLNHLIGALALASIVSPALAQTPPSPARGGTLIGVLEPEPFALVSIVNNNYPLAIVTANVFDGLAVYDRDFVPQPALAERWDIAPDGLSITFHLRRGVKWHDGQDFTSDDVRYSALELWKKFHPRGRSTYAALKDVETPDPHTAVFRLEHPSLVIFSALSAAESPVLPAHLYEGTEPLKNPHNSKPVGTGPFAFKEWKKGQYVELVRNEHYWVENRPYLDRVIFRTIPDAASRAAALETGEVLYAPFDAVPFPDVARLEEAGLKAERRGYDFQSQFLQLEFNLKNPILANLKVREAIEHAIDRQGLIETAWYGFGKPATGPIPSSLKRFYTPDVSVRSFDAARAEALLDEAGYPRKAGGVRFAISQDYAPISEGHRLSAEYIRQNLKQVGIELEVRTQDMASYTRRVFTDYDFDTQLGQYSAMIDPEMGLFRKLLSTNYIKGVPNMNVSSYANPETDALIAKIRSEADPEKRAELFKSLQGIVQKDLPFLSLTEIEHVTIHSNRLRGVAQTPDGALSSFRDVWLAP
ncbi:ABC transporter substrate-binding protein [Terrihabitans sp. B22-R8]|uniref:ABC transporter substrate-binding protein n=1 Tax=Terrihabitans sp. B22-R8 TaxID=3425128 RepID=UPI00403C714C